MYAIIHLKVGDDMKICEKCGASNSDKRRFCIDCGEILGDKLSAAQEQQYRNKIGEQIENMYNKKDPLYVSLYDKIVGIISIIGVALCSVLVVMNFIIQKTREGLLMSIALFMVAGIEAFVPKFTWSIEKMRLGFYANGADELEPSELYVLGRRISMTLLVLVGVTIIITSYL